MIRNSPAGIKFVAAVVHPTLFKLCCLVAQSQSFAVRQRKITNYRTAKRSPIYNESHTKFWEKIMSKHTGL